MGPRDIVRELRRKPFRPFRITITEGSSNEIKHPELCLVTRTSVYIGLDPTDDDLLAERSVLIDVGHVVKLDPIPTPAKGKKP